MFSEFKAQNFYIMTYYIGNAVSDCSIVRLQLSLDTVIIGKQKFCICMSTCNVSKKCYPLTYK